MHAIVQDQTEVKCRGETLDEIWWQGRQWAVTSYGIEARDGTYVIEKHRLREELYEGRSWIFHVGDKEWVDIEDFSTAYFVACSMHGARLSTKEAAMLRQHFDKLAKDRARRRLLEPFRRQAEKLILGPKADERFRIIGWDQICEIDAKTKELARAAGAIP